MSLRNPPWVDGEFARKSRDWNCVAIAARAGKDQWFSFLLSVKPIAEGEKILSNALAFDKEWRVEEEEEKGKE